MMRRPRPEQPRRAERRFVSLGPFQAELQGSGRAALQVAGAAGAEPHEFLLLLEQLLLLLGLVVHHPGTI